MSFVEAGRRQVNFLFWTGSRNGGWGFQKSFSEGKMSIISRPFSTFATRHHAILTKINLPKKFCMMANIDILKKIEFVLEREWTWANAGQNIRHS